MNKSPVIDLIGSLIPEKNSLHCSHNEDILIVSNKQCEIFYFNSVGSDIWDLINGSNTIQDIFRTILSLYDVDENELSNDLVEIIRKMQWSDLIVLSEK